MFEQVLSWVKLHQRVAEIERRLENQMRHGTVKEVDAKKGLMRLTVGKDLQGAEQLSPWIPYGQHMGDWKFHNPPSVGQTFTMFSPSGDFRQAQAIPLMQSDKNKSPSDKPDEHVITYGEGEHKLTIKHTKEETTIMRGDTAIHWTKDGITAKAKLFKHEGDRVEHDGKNIGKDHKHLHVLAGPDKTDIPDT